MPVTNAIAFANPSNATVNAVPTNSMIGSTNLPNRSNSIPNLPTASCSGLNELNAFITAATNKPNKITNAPRPVAAIAFFSIGKVLVRVAIADLAFFNPSSKTLNPCAA